MDWSEALTHQPLYLNLGGNRHCHPAKMYQNYVVVDLNPPSQGWAIRHDLRKPLPLPDGSVDRILTEDFLEHIAALEISAVLAESYRVLKPGGLMRIGVPDYANPKDRIYLEQGRDPRYPAHVTMTCYPLLSDLIHRSPFGNGEFYQYWEGERFYWKAVDYSLGFIQRTPENYYRYFTRSIFERIRRFIRVTIGDLRTPADVKAKPGSIYYGHPLYATSVVVDLIRQP